MNDMNYLITYLMDGEVIEITDDLINERMNICNECDKKQIVTIAVPKFKLKLEENPELNDLTNENPELFPEIYGTIVSEILEKENGKVKETDLYEVDWDYPEKAICSECGCGLEERTGQLIGYCPLFKWKFGKEEWEKHVLPQIEEFIEKNGSDPIEWRKREDEFENE